MIGKDYMSAKIAEEMINLPNPGKKTMLASWMGEDDISEGKRILEKGNIPCFNIP